MMTFDVTTVRSTLLQANVSAKQTTNSHLSAASPANRQPSLDTSRKDVCAPSNEAPCRTAGGRPGPRSAEVGQTSPFPSTAKKVEQVAASFKAGGCGSVRQYMSRAKREGPGLGPGHRAPLLTRLLLACPLQPKPPKYLNGWS